MVKKAKTKGKILSLKDIQSQLSKKFGTKFSFIEITKEENGIIFEIKLKHEDCGKEFVTNPEIFLKKGVCPYCYIPRYNKEKTDAQFRKEVYDKYGDRYEIITPYINSRTKIKIRCKNCQKEKEILPYPFLHHYQCSCVPKKKNKPKLKRTTEEFKQEVYDLVGDEYTVLGEYKGANVKTLMRHNVCGRTFEIEPVRFLNNKVRCIPCNRNYTKTTEEFKQEVYDLAGDDFTVLDEYKNAKTKVTIKCNSCNTSEKYLPRNFLMIKKCPHCGHKKNSITSKKK